MRRGFVIDRKGTARPAARPDRGAPDMLYVGLTRTGAEVVLGGAAVPAPALVKAVHILAVWKSPRIALSQPSDGGPQVQIFSGVWEFAAAAEALAQGWSTGAPPEQGEGGAVLTLARPVV